MISGLLEQIRPEVPSQDGIAYSAEVVESNIPNCAVEAHVYPDWEITACATTTVGRWDIATTEVDLAARTVTVRLNPHPDCGEEDFKMLVIHFVPKYAEGAKLPARPQ